MKLLHWLNHACLKAKKFFYFFKIMLMKNFHEIVTENLYMKIILIYICFQKTFTW